MKIAYVISNIDYSVAFEWIVERMHQKSMTFVFIFLGEKKPKLQSILEAKGVECEFMCLNHSVYGYMRVVCQLIGFLNRRKFDIVHTHLFHASLLGLIAAKILGVNKRIHTRHHSTFHHEYHPHAIKYDKLISFLSTHIVAISKNVYRVLVERENIKHKKISIINHGFDLLAFDNVTTERICVIHEKYSIPKDKIIIGVISRYFKLKGVGFIIEAFKEVLNTNTNVHLVLANAKGADEKSIKEKLSVLSQNDFTEIVFEEDLFALYKVFDIFVHTPINNEIEAFGQTYVEALAAGVPSVFTKSGIANDFISNEINALVVDYKNSKQIAIAIEALINNKELTSDLIENGKKSVELFAIKHMIDGLVKLYSN